MENTFNIEKFKELMMTAFQFTENTKYVTPVFANVPEKLRAFAAKTMNVLETKAKVSFSSLKDMNLKNLDKRTFKDNPLNLPSSKDDNDSIPVALNWIVNLLKSMIEKLDEQGDIIRVHTDVLANPKEVIDVSKEEMDALKSENEKLKIEIDETRQRGMKGNIIISCPVRDGVSKAVHVEKTEGDSTRMETDTELVLRLIREKTKVIIPKDDVVACHPMSKKDKNTFVIRIMNVKPGSAWEDLTACMMKGTNMDRRVPVYINYQLTDRRAALAKAVRIAKADAKISGYSVDQNGRIKIRQNGGQNYENVKSVEHLNGVLA